MFLTYATKCIDYGPYLSVLLGVVYCVSVWYTMSDISHCKFVMWFAYMYFIMSVFVVTMDIRILV